MGQRIKLVSTPVPGLRGQVLFAECRRVKYCGQYSCDEPLADAELYMPSVYAFLKGALSAALAVC